MTSAPSWAAVSSSVTSNSKSPPASVLHRLVGAGALGFQHAHQLVVLDDHPLGRQLGGELDALDGFLVGGVGGADEQPVAALAQHHQLVLHGELRVDDVARQPRACRPRSGRAAAAPARWTACGPGRPAGRRRRRPRPRRSWTAPLLGAACQVFGGLGAELAGMHEHARDPGKGRLGRLDERVNGHRLDASLVIDRIASSPIRPRPVNRSGGNACNRSCPSHAARRAVAASTHGNGMRTQG